MKRILLAMLILSVAAALAAQSSGLYIQIGRWQPDVDGDVTTNPNEVVDVASDLALDDDAPTLFSAKLVGERHVLIYTTWDLGASETTLLGEDLYAGESFFPAGTEVSSSLSAELKEVQYRYLFLRTPMMKVGGVVAYHWLDTAFRVEDERYGSDVSYPSLGIGLTALTPRGKVYGDVIFLYGEGSDTDSTLIRAEGGVDVTRSLGIFIGAQLFDLDGDFGGNPFEWSFTGVFAGVHLHL